MKRPAQRTTLFAVRFRNAAALTLACCTAVVATGCSSPGEKDQKPDTSAKVTQTPASSAPADPKAAASSAATSAYAAYWKEMEKLYADLTGKNAKLDQYAASVALRNAEADAKRAHDRGRVYRGSVALTDQAATEVETSGKVPRVKLSSCLDVSRWQTVVAKTGKPVTLPVGRLTKYRIATVVEKYPEGWRVTRDEPQGKSC